MAIVRHCLRLAAVAVLTCGLGSIPSGDSAFAESSIGSANRITAVYRVDLAGFSLGDFRLTTQFNGDDYEIRGEGRFSVLEGLVFDWHGTTASVTQISQVPKRRLNPHVIPTTKEQLEGVLDPMSAAFLYARSDNPNGDMKVCDQTVPVFDGEQRFNLVLKPKRTERLQKNSSTGYSGFAAVCRVKFIPISGYRPDNPGIKLMSETNDIEVWLVSLPGTEMYVPYRILLPTLVGFGSATSTSFEIQRGAKRASLDQ